MTRVLARFPAEIAGTAPIAVKIEGATAVISIDLSEFEEGTKAYTDTAVANLAEVVAGKQPLDQTLTALAAVATIADRLIYATGVDTFAATDLTSFARSLLAAVDEPAVRLLLALNNVDNTSDATKNAATATLTNKTLAAPVINSPTGLVKANVGLGNVDNTSDASKPVSSAQQTALDLKFDKAGGTVADLLAVISAGWSVVRIGSGAGQRRRLQFMTGASERWTIEADDGAEAGANAGSDLEIRRHADGGADLGVAWRVIRATGEIVPGADDTFAIGRADRRLAKLFLALGDFADDAAAAAGGVGVGQLYQTAGAVKIRVA